MTTSPLARERLRSPFARFAQSETSRTRPWEILVCLLVAGTALRALLPGFLRTIGDYDEGLLLTDAFLISEGQVPHRDFYANYPPGPFLTVLAGFELFGASAFTARCLGFGALVSGALVAGRVAGRLIGQRFSVVAVAVVLALQARMTLEPFAYVTAVLLAMLCVATVPATDAHATRRLLHGFLFGTISWFRHDLFVQSSLALVVLAGSLGIVPRTRAIVPPRAAWLATAAGAAFAVAVMFVPLVALAGVGQVLDDLVFDQVRMLPARALPFPSFRVSIEVPALGISLPGVIAESMRALLALTAVTLVGLVAILPKRLTDPSRDTSDRFALVWLVAFALGAVPHAMGRVDYAHVAYGMPIIASAAVVVLAHRPLIRVCLALLAIVPLLASDTPLARADVFANIAGARTDAALLSIEQRDALAVIRARTRPSDPLFVGCTDHRRVGLSAVGMHYLSRRLGATRRMQFDPILVTSDDGQREMIRDLQLRRPPLILRFVGCHWTEPNASAEFGSDALDRYLDAHYEPLDTSTRGYRYAVRRD